MTTATSPLKANELFRTYTGLLDDVMIRYSDDYASEEFFNKMIAKNIFFGGGLYLNDGYLVNHPVARRYLVDENSLLRVMIRTHNFVRILTRTKSPEELVAMPKTMAGSGNDSFGRLIASPEWSSFEPVFRDLAVGLFYSSNARPWPGFDMSVGFRKLMGRPLEAHPADLGLQFTTHDQLRRIRDDFYGRRPEQGNPRDKLEKAVLHVVQDPRGESAAEVMSIANQAYHYNFGLMLTAEEDHGVAVDTTIGMAFDELLSARSVERGQIDSIPLIKVPEVPFGDGEAFIPFCDPTTRVGGAKLAYLHKLRELLSVRPKSLEDAKKDVRAATNEYIARIKELFEARYGRLSVDLGDALSFTQVLVPRKRSRNVVGATAAPMAGLAVALQASARAFSRRFLIERFHIVDATEEFNRPASVVTIGDVRPQLAQVTSLAFDQGAAKTFMDGIPCFNK